MDGAPNCCAEISLKQRVSLSTFARFPTENRQNPAIDGYPFCGVTEQFHRAPSIAEIQTAVSRYHHLDPADMRARTRGSPEVSQARQTAMLLSRELTPCSLAIIGRLFGKRDHTTIYHGIRAARARLQDNEYAQRDLVRVMAMLTEIVGEAEDQFNVAAHSTAA